MIRIQPKPVPRHLKALWFPLGTLILILLGTSFWVQPLQRERQQLETELNQLESEITSYLALEMDNSLEKQVATASQRHRWFTREWEQYLPNIKRFREEAVSEIISQSSEGRIDFKIALFESRYRLSQLGMAHGTSLPSDLGIPDTIGANESADIRLGQLTATMLLLEKCITMDIPIIDEVRASPPERLPLEDTPLPALAFYPVHIRMQTTFEGLVALLNHLQEEPLFYYLQHLRIEKPIPGNTTYLSVYTMWSVAGYVPNNPVRSQAEIILPNTDPDNPFYYEE